MLLIVTDHCSMNCPHCLSDCKPDSHHISIDQFKKNLDYCLSILRSDQVLILSGGEPFEHPQIKELLQILNNELNNSMVLGVTITTNGLPLVQNPKLLEWYREFCKKCNKKITTQVTSVKGYYPILLTDKNKYHLSKIKRLVIVDSPNEIQLYPQGRALSMDNPIYMTKAPKCVNIRLLANQIDYHNFSQLVRFMPFGFFCTPRINVDGTISLGESKLCPKIGSIDDNDYELFMKVKNYRCSQCNISMDILKNTNPVAYNLIMKGHR